jgi:hypothetical protein
MNHSRQPSYDSPARSDDALAARYRRLGTALHQLAMDLARERRRTAELERELARVLRPAAAERLDDREHRVIADTNDRGGHR